MLAFNQKTVKNINKEVRDGETVIIKVSNISRTAPKSKTNTADKKIDTVTSGSFETKMHFARSHATKQVAPLKKTVK